MKKSNIIKVFWLLLFFATIALYVYAGKEKKSDVCKGIKVEVVGKKEYVFINEDQIKNIVAYNGGRTGVVLDSVNLGKIEKALSQDVWVKKVDVFFDNQDILQVKIDQSDPIARVFTKGGETFYIDSTEKYLPVSNKVTTRLPVFTSFPEDGINDSLLIKDIKTLSVFIKKDTFWSSMISQINIVKHNEFEIVPTIGNHMIHIGTANNLPDKFNKLYSFYNQVALSKGLDKYRKIDLQYRGQIVATLRDSTRKANSMFGAAGVLYDTTFANIVADSVIIGTAGKVNTQKPSLETGQKKLNTKEKEKDKSSSKTSQQNKRTNNNN